MSVYPHFNRYTVEHTDAHRDAVPHGHSDFDAHCTTCVDTPTYEHLHSHSHPHHTYPDNLTPPTRHTNFNHTHRHTHERGTSLLRGPNPAIGRVATGDRGPTVMRSPTDISAEMVGGELRVTNPVTGGQKGTKDSQLSAAPAEAMLALGRVYGFGAKKYARHNFRKGYAWSLSYDAMMRHIEASLAGEDYDPESGLPHMAHAAWHALTLTQFLIDQRMERHPKELDDRFEVQNADD